MIKLFRNDLRLLKVLASNMLLPLLTVVLGLVLLKLAIAQQLSSSVNFAYINILNYFSLVQIAQLIAAADAEALYITRVRLACLEMEWIVSRIALTMLVAFVWSLLLVAINLLLFDSSWYWFGVLLNASVAILLINNFIALLTVRGGALFNIVLGAPLVAPALILSGLALEDVNYQLLLLALTIFLIPLMGFATRALVAVNE